MEINKFNNTPNFGARVIVNKTGFRNIANDIVDSFEIGSRTTGSISSTVGETTSFPSEISTGIGFPKSIKNHFIGIKNAFRDIFHRNIKTSILEDAGNVEHSALSSSNVASGSGLITTGSGSYGSSVASGLDQSANYPLFGSESVPQMIADSNKPILTDITNALKDFAFDVLYVNRRGIGNEQAWLASSLTSSSGATLLGSGAKVIKNAGNTNISSRKIPS